MFKSARIKLTAWYLTIIMFLTISFSAFVYMGVDFNTRRALESQSKRFETQFKGTNQPPQFPMRMRLLDVQTLIEIREKTLVNLIRINTTILIIAGSLGYFLAGKTLKPIELMVNKQKRFVSDAAHEIKTPLTAMKTGLEVALRDKNLSTEQAKDTIKSALEDVENLHSLSSRLLRQSKYQNGNNIGHDEISLDKLLKEILKNLKPLADKKNETFNLNLTSTKVKGSKEEIQEMLTNLIENSIKFNKEGSRVNISLTSTTNSAVIEIEDFGMGIAKKDLPNIFEPFYRADKARTDSGHEGYGLGLTIAKEIAERYHGGITVQSEPDKGSKFTVHLPLSK